VLIVVICWLAGDVAAFVDIPAPYLLTSIAIGALLAISGSVQKQFPRPVNIAAITAVGVLMGCYLDLDSARDIAEAGLGLIGAIIATLVLGLVAGLLLPRLISVDARDAVLGMVPGGSSAVVAIADEFKADLRIVAFMQYLRIALFTASVPLILVFVGAGGGDAFPSPADSLDDRFIAELKLVDADDQLLGFAELVALCVLGYVIGRLLRLPAAAFVGPMLLTVGVSLFIKQQFSPSEIFKEYLFVVIGLEIGLRFSREALRHIWRLIPGIVLAIITLALASCGISYLLSRTLDIPFIDAYLAITPADMNAALAAAVSADADLTIISTVQTLRMILGVILTPLLLRWILKRRKPVAPEPDT
jgi:membrane AbrB-like protein